jgi:hypothetical protein
MRTKPARPLRGVRSRRCVDAALARKRHRIRRTSPESYECRCGVDRVARAEQVIVQFHRERFVEGIATFFERLKRIRFEYLSPQTAIVAGSVIVAAKKVPEVSQAVINVGFAHDPEALKTVRLEFV